jgi:hypothetical protein
LGSPVTRQVGSTQRWRHTRSVHMYLSSRYQIGHINAPSKETSPCTVPASGTLPTRSILGSHLGAESCIPLPLACAGPTRTDNTSPGVNPRPRPSCIIPHKERKIDLFVSIRSGYAAATSLSNSFKLISTPVGYEPEPISPAKDLRTSVHAARIRILRPTRGHVALSYRRLISLQHHFSDRSR